MIFNAFVYRREAGLKQREVAKILGISPGTYHKKENGIVEFTMSEGIKLANYYGVTLDDLFRKDLFKERAGV